MVVNLERHGEIRYIDVVEPGPLAQLVRAADS